jgi:F-type H+-transporting ATPase subunit epsilon
MTLSLEILVPDHTVLETNVLSVEAADATGRFGLHPGHEPFVTVLEPCVLIYVDEQEIERYAALEGGVLYLEANRVSIATREAVLADRLQDVADRVATTLEARRSREHSARSEFAQLQATLVYELGRLDRRAAP